MPKLSLSETCTTASVGYVSDGVVFEDTMNDIVNRYSSGYTTSTVVSTLGSWATSYVTINGIIDSTGNSNIRVISSGPTLSGTMGTFLSSGFVSIPTATCTDGYTYYLNQDGGSIVLTNNGNVVSVQIFNKEEQIKSQIKSLIRGNLSAKSRSRYPVLSPKVSKEEIKARDTLRDLITEKEWRRYLTNGFVLIKAQSGKYYQVFNDQRHIRVYVKGVLTDEICIHTHSDTKCPPTDHILNMMFLINNDENLIWSKGVGNVYKKTADASVCVEGVVNINNNVTNGVATLASTYSSVDVDITKTKNISEAFKKLKAVA